MKTVLYYCGDWSKHVERRRLPRRLCTSSFHQQLKLCEHTVHGLDELNQRCNSLPNSPDKYARLFCQALRCSFYSYERTP